MTVAVERVTVLVVSDRPDDRAADAPLFCFEGADVLLAGSAIGACELHRVNPFAVAILDHRVGVPDCRTLLDCIGFPLDCHDLPLILLVAADTDPCVALNSGRAGLVDVIVGDVHPGLLQAKVRLFVEMHRRRRQLDQAAAALATDRDRLVSTLTHDLRTPLAAAMLCTEKLSFELRRNADGSVRRTLGQLNACAERMAVAIEELSSLSAAAADARQTPSAATSRWW